MQQLALGLTVLICKLGTENSFQEKKKSAKKQATGETRGAPMRVQPCLSSLAGGLESCAMNWSLPADVGILWEPTGGHGTILSLYLCHHDLIAPDGHPTSTLFLSYTSSSFLGPDSSTPP